MSHDQSNSLNRRFHLVAWWLMAILFVTLTVVGLTVDLAPTVWPMVGVLFIIGVTFLRGIVLAIDFARKGERPEIVWAVLLILLLTLAAVLGYST